MPFLTHSVPQNVCKYTETASCSLRSTNVNLTLFEAEMPFRCAIAKKMFLSQLFYMF